MEAKTGSKESKSRVLGTEIKVPGNISINLDKSILTIKGPKGEVKRDFSDKRISMDYKNSIIMLRADKSNKISKKIIKSYSSHINNMIKGSLETHKYILKICSGHFPMSVSVNNKELILKNFLGEKIPRKLRLKEGAVVRVEGDMIMVESASKEIAGQVSADMEQLTRRTGYDSRVFQDGIYIVNKDGKEIS